MFKLIVNSLVFKSIRLASESKSFFKTNVQKAREDLPIIHDTFRKKQDVKAVSRNGSITAFAALA